MSKCCEQKGLFTQILNLFKKDCTRSVFGTVLFGGYAVYNMHLGHQSGCSLKDVELGTRTGFPTMAVNFKGMLSSPSGKKEEKAPGRILEDLREREREK